MKLLPSQANPLTLEQSKKRFQDMAQSKLLQFCGPAPRSSFLTVQSFVNALASSSPPGVDKAMDSPFVSRVKAKLALWCTYDTKDEAGAAKTVKGRAAAQARLKDLVAKQAKAEEISYADVLPLHVFQWLLDTSQASMLKKISSEIALKSKKDAGAAASSSSTATLGMRARRTSEADTKKMVAALFTRK